MEEKLKNSMRFYMLATQLKYKIRSGWDKSLYYDDEEYPLGIRTGNNYTCSF